MQKALEQMNVKLTEVVSDITGVTGMAIIHAILAGERDPKKLASLRDSWRRRMGWEIARALEGSWRAEHLFALKQAVELYEFYRRQRRACDTELEAQLRAFADRTDGRPLERHATRRSRTRRSNEPAFECVREVLYRMSGADLTAVEGVDESTALVILAEIGVDVSWLPTVKHFTSWLGLCPQHQGSAGKIKSRGVRRGTTGSGAGRIGSSRGRGSSTPRSTRTSTDHATQPERPCAPGSYGFGT